MIEPEDMPEVVFADATAVESLDDYVRVLLKSLAKHFGHPGMAGAWVSDESMVADFCSGHSKADTLALEQVAEDLGFTVKAGDYVYEVAIKLRDQ